MPSSPFSAHPTPDHSPNPGDGRALALLEEARHHDRAGDVATAIGGYQAAIAAAERENDQRLLAEALRALAIAHHRLGERQIAADICHRSQAVAEASGDHGLAAQALNTLAAFDLSDGRLDEARVAFTGALRWAGGDMHLTGRIQQNLGIIANIKGELAAALTYYEGALKAFEEAGDERGCAMAYNSLGLLSADQKRWDDAERHFARSLELTTRLGDVFLRGQALISQTEVQIARERYVAAQRNAEEALRIFDRLNAKRNKSDAYRVLGIVYRAMGRRTLAEARLRSATELARAAGALLEEAEATRELAQLYRDLGRNQDALQLLNVSRRLFNELGARADMVDVVGRVESLESAFLAIVLDWGQSIESADSYTHGHCERVAEYSVSVGRHLKLDDDEIKTIRLGAYLHDLGKVRVPHEILNKSGRLTEEEFEAIKRHPIDGVELLEGIEFPWDIIPMVRWHHEKCDGSGYPDGLRGEQIPLHPQIICIVDVYDALTTTRSYRGAMSPQAAMAIIREHRAWWRPDVFDAFVSAMESAMLASEDDAPLPLDL